ncbi:helix-turn-helix domain-containing protein [Abyssisolibacter fermentans]|uniref:helix-turn-helix domain-containing protein n=1 Tax=Abyssisolibacter fermentans TaxID=1766203 RepID=UPI00082EB299|nr:helix-turn-helix domain-containing protein [Abyssisolibacter fermentans]
MIDGSQKYIQAVIRNINKHAFYWHDSIAIINVLKGTIKLNKKTKEYTLKRNDIVIINVREVYDLEGVSKDNMVLFIFINEIFCRVKIKDFDNIVINCNTVVKKNHNQQQYKKLQNYVLELVFALTGKKDSKYNKNILVITKKLLIFIVEQFDYIKFGLNFKKFDSKHIERYKCIYEYVFTVNGQLREASLKEIADYFGMNYDYLRKDIKKKFGHPFKWLKFSIMVENAFRLLLTTDANIMNIGYDCGFSDPKYLIKYFKMFYNCTPSTLRRKYKNKYEQNYQEFFNSEYNLN